MSPKPAAKAITLPQRGKVVRKQMHLTPAAIKNGEAVRRRIGAGSFTEAVEFALRFAAKHAGPDREPYTTPVGQEDD